jgi:hypothetical protein
MSNKTLKISEASKKKLDALCELHNLNIGEAVEAMINFFDASKQNPATYKNIQDDFMLLVSKQLDILKKHLQTENEAIIRVMQEKRAEEVAKKANRLFKDFKIDLESQKTALGYIGVGEAIKVYSKQFEALEKENSTSNILLKTK